MKKGFVGKLILLAILMVAAPVVAWAGSRSFVKKGGK